MELELEGKVALVTGASRGIGAAIARELAREGVDLVTVARSAADLDKEAAEIARQWNRRVVPYAADLRLRAAAGEAVARAIEAFGRLDILVNSAGATKRGDFFALTDDDWADGYELKFHGAVRLCRAAWPHLKQATGSIVNIVGVGARAGEAEFTIGGSVNAAYVHFTKSLADIGVGEGVRVNAISPGRIVTPRFWNTIGRLSAERGQSREEAMAELLHDIGIARFGEPNEIGWLAAFLCSPRAAFIHGAVIDIDGGQTRAV
jgi:NAD(P)-dependent dehydrogenase (short-subunit alcohol dehydrogenase family)